MIPPPCFGQTAASIKCWLRLYGVCGQVVAVRNSSFEMLQYIPASIVQASEKRFELQLPVYQNLGGNVFYLSGRNAWHQGSRARIVIPTPQIQAAYCKPLPWGSGFGPFTV